MAKGKKYLAALLAVILVGAVCGMSAAEPDVRRMETAADADEWIAVFLGEHPEALDAGWAMSAQMETAVAGLGGIGGLAKQLAALGTVEKIHPAYEGKVQGYRAFLVPCEFSAMSVDIVLILQDGAIAGLSTGVYSGEKEEPAESDVFDSIGLALPVPSLGGELPGILTVPSGEGPFPAVVLVHGSGPSDKDETIVSLKPFRDLAEGLAEKGIAVYRFDKRTYVYGTILAADRQITLADESIEDAVNAVRLLSQQEKIDPDRVFVLGHSLGGNAIPAIARELNQSPVQACGFIMMAASPRPLEELIREQTEFLYSVTPGLTAEQQAEKDALLADLDRLKNLDSLSEDEPVMGGYPAYWKWLASYDILQAAAEITQPVLLLQGEEDYQVTMADFGVWKNAFGRHENWTLISYPGLTHPFTAGRKAEASAAYARAERVDDRVIRDIADFVIRTGGNP